jgi:predicted RecB family endonuclease
MEAPQTTTQPTATQLPIRLVAELQDALLIVVHDLNRLDHLLTRAMEGLMSRFVSASENLSSSAFADLKELDATRFALQAAVTELQFQDLASQLIGHTSKTLQGCAYRLACESMCPEDGEAVPFVEEVPDRPNPVTQDEMDAGSIELF